VTTTGTPPSIGLRKPENVKDYYFDPGNPQLAVDQALRELGIMPATANPYTQFTRKRAASNLVPLHLMQQAVSGGDLSSESLRQFLLGALSGQGMVPTGTGLFEQAAQASRGMRGLLSGVSSPEEADAIMSDPASAARMVLMSFMQDPRNVIAMRSAAAGMAPGFQRLYQRGLEDVYGGFEAMAPQYAQNNVDFADFLAGLGGTPGPKVDWEAIYGQPLPGSMLGPLLVGTGG